MGEFNRFVKADQLKFFLLVKLTILKHFDFAPLCLLLQGGSHGSTATARSAAAVENRTAGFTFYRQGVREHRVRGKMMQSNPDDA